MNKLSALAFILLTLPSFIWAESSISLNNSSPAILEDKKETVSKIDLDDPVVRKEIIAQATEVTVEEKDDGTIVFYELLTRSPYKGTGWVVIYYDDGIKLNALLQLKDGKQEGLATQWHDNAIKKSEVYFSKNEKRGTCKHWFSNGKLKKIHMHLPHNGKINGQATDWYENGEKKEEANLKDGKPEGLATFWYDNGEKEEEVNWKDGKQEGLATKWYENGQKKEELNWKDGVPDGLQTQLYMEGVKKAELNWKDGKPEGLASFWYENGQKASEGNVKVGKVMTVIKWKPNGEICPVTNVKGGSGISVVYNEDGTEKERFTFKDGEKIEVEESKSNQLDLPEIENELDQLLLDSDISPSLQPPPIK